MCIIATIYNFKVTIIPIYPLIPFRLVKKYSKKGKWTAFPEKEKKSYPYVAQIMSGVAAKKLEVAGLKRKRELSPDDPRRKQRTLARPTTQTSSELYENMKSRFREMSNSESE